MQYLDAGEPADNNDFIKNLFKMSSRNVSDRKRTRKNKKGYNRERAVQRMSDSL